MDSISLFLRGMSRGDSNFFCEIQIGRQKTPPERGFMRGGSGQIVGMPLVLDFTSMCYAPMGFDLLRNP